MADTIAGMPEGKWAAIGVGIGALIPLSPVFTAMALKKEFTGRTAQVAGGCSVVLFAGTFIYSWIYGND
jgi:hypothetical protein